ncbi:hypothetical protein CQ10_26210 [Bradyrhizobium valentinum]|nr:hypothetical protein CQ10_26210 [Bradyrhizobium valentinum]
MAHQLGKASRHRPTFVREITLEIPWASGFAPVQKRKNVKALHEAAAKRGFTPLLEISTKSDVVVGQHLSAFHLKIQSKAGPLPLESVYQGSKVFEQGGPYTDIYDFDARTAKRDGRLRDSGRLIRFEFDGHSFPLVPPTVFYDWLYLTAIYPHREWLKERIIVQERFAGFTDIEFNPSKSINCQARSCALFVALIERELLDEAMTSPEVFIKTVKTEDHSSTAKENENRLAL